MMNNKFEEFIKQSYDDKHILNKLKTEVEKVNFEEINLMNNIYHKIDIIEKIIRAIYDIENSEVIDKCKELGENFDYAKLTTQYKKLYDDLNLESYYNESIEDFIIRFNRLVSDGLSSIILKTLLEEIFQNVDMSAYVNVHNIDALYKLKNIRDINTNMVVIGKNGSGKSTYINSFREDVTSNVYSINANRLLELNNQSTHYTPYKLEEEFEKLFLKQEKMGYIHFGYFTTVIKYLISHNTLETEKLIEKRLTTKVFNVMENIFPYLKINIDPAHQILKVYNRNRKDDEPYELEEMSSGEKSTLYLISIVLMVKENSYILIDEPEINLNPYLSRKLWDILEKQRPDSIFIYATHDRDFASSRLNSTYIWNKSFIYPNEWDQEIISDNTLPKELIFDLLGEENRKLLVEGRYSSLDYQLYNVLFFNFQVVPAGGHKEVINKQKHVNQSEHQPNTISLIDRDYYPSDELKKLESHKVFAIKYNEVENLLFKITLDFFEDDFKDTIQDIKEEYGTYFLKEVEKINNEIMKYDLMYKLTGKESLEQFRKEYESFKQKDKMEAFGIFYDFSKERIADLDKMLKVIPLKESIEDTDKSFFAKVIDLIRENADLRSKIVDKYFPEIFLEQ